jgi:hypothetical protein
LGASTFWNPQGLSRPVMGLLTITEKYKSWNRGKLTSTLGLRKVKLYISKLKTY